MLTRVVFIGALAIALGFFVQAGPASASSLDNWQNSVAQSVASKQIYPRTALIREMEGVARVRVTMDRSGAIQSYEVIESTGHKILDGEISRLMDRVNPLPKPPQSLSEAELTFDLPLSWVLN